MLWSRLRDRQLNGLKFRRQHPMEPYVLDFYCAELRLALEIDGYVHPMGDRAEKDRRRDDWLKGQGVEVIRINASAVLKSIDDVMDHLSRGLSERSPSPLGGKRHDGEAE